MVFALAGDSTITSDLPAPFPYSSTGTATAAPRPLPPRLERVAADLERAAPRALPRGAALFRAVVFFVVLLAVFFLAAI